MTVTAMERPTPRLRLTHEQITSIRLAVAQWMRSARAVGEAQGELRTLGVSPDEIFRRRRADSADVHLAALLRLAVTLVITRGTLEDFDRRRFAPVLGDDVVQSAVRHVADAVRFISHVERSRGEPVSNIDLDVGDY